MVIPFFERITVSTSSRLVEVMISKLVMASLGGHSTVKIHEGYDPCQSLFQDSTAIKVLCIPVVPCVHVSGLLLTHVAIVTVSDAPIASYNLILSR